MRVFLEKGKQKELILNAKKDKTWDELAKITLCKGSYLGGDLRREKRTLTEEMYQRLCFVGNCNFDNHIIKKLPHHWGQVIGARNSPGSTISINIPPYDADLAEFVGAVLGDGHIASIISQGVYQVNITGDSEKDREYHLDYLNSLGKRLFNIAGKETLAKHNKGRHLIFYSVEMVKFFGKMGLKAGSKIKNQSTIPKWIWEKEEFLRNCLRGLIDTDGSIFKMSNQDPRLLRMSFTNYNSTLLEDTRKAFISLGFFPSKIIKKKQFFLSRKEDIRKYLKEVGFSNKRHLDRIKMFKAS